MKIKLSFLLFLSLALFLSVPAHAGGLINKNFGVEYLGTGSRNAATDSADAVVYNPAGVMKLDNGVYGHLDLSYFFKNYENQFYANNDSSSLLNKVDSESDDPSYPPSLYALYKQDKFSGFLALTIPAGGGKVTYDKGTATTNDYAKLISAKANSTPPLPSFGVSLIDYVKSQRIEAYSIYYGCALGTAFEINKMISVAAGLRFLTASKEGKAQLEMQRTNLGTNFGAPSTFEVDYEDTADGYNAFFGVNISPSDVLNIGFRYETRAELEFERQVNKDDTKMLKDGAKWREDLPGQFGLGVAIKATPKINFNTSFTLYLEKDACLQEYEKLYNSRFEGSEYSYDFGASVEYTINEKLSTTIGYLYTNTDISPENMSPEAPELDADTVNFGLRYKPTPNLSTLFSISKVFYDNDIRSDHTKFDKSLIVLGLGVQYHFATN